MPRAVPFALVILLVAVFSAACVGFSDPRGWAEPAFEGDEVYVFLDRQELVAVTLDEFGGEYRWRFPESDIAIEDDVDLEAVYGRPLFVGDRIILAGFSGQLVSISRGGRLAGERSWWRDDVDGSIVGGAVLAGDRIAFGTTERRLYIRNVNDGGAAEAWALTGRVLGSEIWSQPVVVGDVLYVGTMDGILHAFSLTTGEELWTFEAGGAIADLADLGNGLLFVPTLGGQVWLVEAASGSTRGSSYKADGWVWTTPAVADGIAYFGDFGGTVHAFDLGTGRARWTYDAGEKVKARPVVIDNRLVVGDEDGVVHFVDLATGNALNAIKIDGAGKIRSGLVEKDGFAWVFGTEGKLYRADPATLTVIEREVRGRP